MFAALTSSTGDVLIGIAAIILAIGGIFGRSLRVKLGNIEAAVGSNGKSLHDAVKHHDEKLTALVENSVTKTEFKAFVDKNTQEHQITVSRLDQIEEMLTKPKVEY